MKPAVPHVEEKLLEFAYGELPTHESEAVEAHVKGCTRCAASLANITAVRKTMQTLPMEPAPDAGLESLLAYAEQHAARVSAPTHSAPWWRRWLAGSASAVALLVVGVVAFKASETYRPDPVAAGLEAAKTTSERTTNETYAPTEELAARPPAAAPAPKPAEAFADALGKRERPAPSKSKDVAPVANEKSKKAVKAFGAGADGDLSAERERGAYNSLPADFGNAGAKRDESARAPERVDGTSATQAMEGNSAGGMFGLRGSTSYRKQEEADKAVGNEVQAAPPSYDAPSDARSRAGGGALGKVSALTPRQVEPEPQLAEKKPESKVVAVPPTAPVAQAPARPSLSLGGLGTKGRGGSGDMSGALKEEAALLDDAENQVDAKMANDRLRFEQTRRAAAVDAALVEARQAGAQGDRKAEIVAAERALRDAQGAQRLEALKRLCDAYEAVGASSSANRVCDALINEFSDSVAARQVVQRRLNKRAPAAPADSSLAH